MAQIGLDDLVADHVREAALAHVRMHIGVGTPVGKAGAESVRHSVGIQAVQELRQRVVVKHMTVL